MSDHGPLTVEGHRAHKRASGESLRVLVDGIDVTRRCRFADDRAGRAIVLCGDPLHVDWRLDGPVHLTPDGGDQGPHTLTVAGHVEIVP